MECPRGRRRPASRSPELLAGWSSLGRSAPKGSREEREPRQRQKEQLASLEYLLSILDRGFLFGVANGKHCMPTYVVIVNGDNALLRGRPLGVGCERKHHHLRKEHPGEQ